MTICSPNRRAVVAAVIAAGLLIFTLGLTHRNLASRLLTPASTTPIDSAALERFPMQIGDWMGEDIPFDEAEVIMPKINAEASINRLYSRDNGMGSVFLFIAASGVTAGTLVGHAPEVCNRSAGWAISDHYSTELVLDRGTKLSCRILQLFCGGALARERKTVLYYYMADSQFCGDRSVLRSKVRRGSSMVNCVAQVQIAASSRGTLPADSATRIVSAFAVDSAPVIALLFENLEKELSSGSSGRACEER